MPPRGYWLHPSAPTGAPHGTPRVSPVPATRARRASTAARSLVGSHAGSVLITTATNFAIALLALATGPLAARMLGPEGRGELAAIQTWPSVIATLAMLGLGDATIYFAA